MRARHFSDTDRYALAAHDYALAHTLFPASRNIYIGLLGSLAPMGESLFIRGEHGHPYSLAVFLANCYATEDIRSSTKNPWPSAARSVPGDIDNINAANRRNMKRHRQTSVPSIPPTPSMPTAPTVPPTPPITPVLPPNPSPPPGHLPAKHLPHGIHR